MKKTSVKNKIVAKKFPVKVLDPKTLTDSVIMESFPSKMLSSDEADRKNFKIPKDAFHMVGKRKRAIVRLWLWKAETKGSGFSFANNRDFFSYLNFCPKFLSNIINPFKAVDEDMSDYCLVCTLKGGGISAQAEAVRLAISKALVATMPEMKAPLKAKGYLTRDSRIVEPKKTGLRGARKKEQYSKR